MLRRRTRCRFARSRRWLLRAINYWLGQLDPQARKSHSAVAAESATSS
ncbi:hypothetical protein H6G04_33195 [Calothrix membranacea FACHB-236]|nr:hypothetical protein [Calothrix membranacea FACHB-236]